MPTIWWLRVAICAAVLTSGLWLLAPTVLGAGSAWASWLPEQTLQRAPELDPGRLWLELGLLSEDGEPLDPAAVTAQIQRLNRAAPDAQYPLVDVQQRDESTLLVRVEPSARSLPVGLPSSTSSPTRAIPVTRSGLRWSRPRGSFVPTGFRSSSLV